MSVDVAESPDPSEVTSGRLMRSTLVNGLANATTALVTAALTPFLLRRLGAEEYGLWLLALSLTFSSGYLALADLGLPEAAIKFIAEARAVGDRQLVNEIASTTLAAFAVIGVAIGLLLAGLAAALVGVFGVRPDLVGTARLLFVLMALEIVIDLPAAGLRAVIEGAQRYAWLRVLDVGARLLWGGLTVGAVVRGHGVVALGALTIAITAAEALVTLIVARRVQPGLRLRPRLVTRRTLRRTLRFGSFVGGLRALSVVYSQMDRAIVGIVVGVAAVATYEVAFRIQSLATLALVMASSAVLPAAAYNAARADTDKQRELYLRGTKYAVAIASPITLAALLYAPPLIRAWVGAPYVGVSNAARLFLVFPLFASFNQVGVAMLIGLGRVKHVLLLQVLAVAINLALSVVLARHFGITGVVTGTLVGGLIVWLPYVRLLLDAFAITPRTWLGRIVRPNLPGPVAQVAIGLLTYRWAGDLRQLWQVGIVYVASVGLSILVFAVLGLAAEERRHLASRLRGG